MIRAFARYLVYDLFGMAQGNRLSDALEFFIYDTIKIFLLLTVIIFIVSIIRSCFPPERTRRILSHKREFIGNILAAMEKGMSMGTVLAFMMAVSALSLPEMIILRKMLKREHYDGYDHRGRLSVQRDHVREAPV